MALPPNSTSRAAQAHANQHRCVKSLWERYPDRFCPVCEVVQFVAAVLIVASVAYGVIALTLLAYYTDA